MISPVIFFSFEEEGIFGSSYLFPIFIINGRRHFDASKVNSPYFLKNIPFHINIWSYSSESHFTHSKTYFWSRNLDLFIFKPLGNGIIKIKYQNIISLVEMSLRKLLEGKLSKWREWVFKTSQILAQSKIYGSLVSVLPCNWSMKIGHAPYSS